MKKHFICAVPWLPSLWNNTMANQTKEKLQQVSASFPDSLRGSWLQDRKDKDERIMFWYESDARSLEDPDVRQLLASLAYLALELVAQPYGVGPEEALLEWWGEKINDPGYFGLIKRTHWGNDTHPRAPKPGDTVRLAGTNGRPLTISEVVEVRTGAWKANLLNP